VDRTLVVPEFRMPGVLRTDVTLAVAGGKGLNVGRSVIALGHPARVVGMLGGRTGEIVAALAQEENLDAHWTAIEGETRTCIVIVSESGGTTVINEAGPEVTAAEWRAFADAALAGSVGSGAVCVCGSLPPGVEVAAYEELLRALCAAGHRVYVDAHSDALASANRTRPHVIKINTDEAAAYLGHGIGRLDAAADAAAELHAAGIAEAVITMGKEGAALACSDGVSLARPAHVSAVSAVGSGDAFLAAYIAAELEGEPPAGALRHGVAAGAANALSPWGGVFVREDYLAALTTVDFRNGVPS
jgi:tagatose 6-phosphate kinase